MNAACRLAIASSLLLGWVGLAGAQVPGTSGREEALPLDEPATQLEPVPRAPLPPADSDALPAEARPKQPEAVKPPAPRRGATTRQRLRREQAPLATIDDRPAWRRTGPPADHPNDAPGVAPGPDYFYLPGHYAPDGENVTWKPGFWARVQPGWEWVPARWVRRPGGWDYRPGSWVRETGALAENNPADQRSTVRPLPGERPSSAVDPDARPSTLEAIPAEPPAIAPGEIEGGVIQGPVIQGPAIPGTGPLPAPQVIVPPGAFVAQEPPSIYIGSVTGMPYHVIRPPGYFPYGPAGVIVPGVVPRFVRRMLDRVLP